jgi:hypothetical protein
MAEAKRAIEAAQVDALQLEFIEERRLKVAMAKLELLRRFYTAYVSLSLAVGGKLQAARAQAKRPR